MSSNMILEMQNIIKDLNSPVNSVRLSAVKQLGNSGHPNTETLEALQKIKRNDKNKFIRYAAKVAIKKLNAILELTGTNRPLSELSDRELIERLLVLQVENKKAISSTQSLLLFVFNVVFLMLFFLSRTL